MFPTKTLIKKLTSNRLKMNKGEIIEKIQYYTSEYMKGGENSKYIVLTFFTVLGLDPKEAYAAFEEIIKDLPHPYKES